MVSLGGEIQEPALSGIGHLRVDQRVMVACLGGGSCECIWSSWSALRRTKQWRQRSVFRQLHLCWLTPCSQSTHRTYFRAVPGLLSEAELELSLRVTRASRPTATNHSTLFALESARRQRWGGDLKDESLTNRAGVLSGLRLLSWPSSYGEGVDATRE